MDDDKRLHALLAALLTLATAFLGVTTFRDSLSSRRPAAAIQSPLHRSRRRGRRRAASGRTPSPPSGRPPRSIAATCEPTMPGRYGRGSRDCCLGRFPACWPSWSRAPRSPRTSRRAYGSATRYRRPCSKKDSGRSNRTRIGFMAVPWTRRHHSPGDDDGAQQHREPPWLWDWLSRSAASRSPCSSRTPPRLDGPGRQHREPRPSPWSTSRTRPGLHGEEPPVLALWLPEEEFADDPLWRLRLLLGRDAARSRRGEHAAPGVADRPPVVRHARPHGLRARRGTPPARHSRCRSRLRILSQSASAPEGLVLSEAEAFRPSGVPNGRDVRTAVEACARDHFATAVSPPPAALACGAGEEATSAGSPLEVTWRNLIAGDQKIGEALVDELERRGIDVTCRASSVTGQVITSSSSRKPTRSYGRALPRAFTAAARTDRGESRTCSEEHREAVHRTLGSYIQLRWPSNIHASHTSAA